MKKSIGWIIVLMLVIGGGYWYYGKKSTPYKSFQIWVTNDLERYWKYYLVEAIDVYLQENSDRYGKSIIEALESTSPDKVESYKNIVAKWEDFITESRSESHNALVKKNILLRRELQKKTNEEKKELLNGLSDKDLGITEEYQKKEDARKEECYKLCLRMLERTRYDRVWYEVKNLTGDERLIQDVAELNLYFDGLPTLSIAFYRSSGGAGWTPFHYKIDCGSYLWQKENMK